MNTLLRNPSVTRLCFTALILVVALMGTASKTHGAVRIGDPLPQLDQFNLEGNLPDSAEGKVLLMDFWASWCGPCRQSFPALNEIHKKFTGQGLVILGVNVDEQRSAMDRFLKKTPAVFNIVRDSKQKLVAALDADTMPTTVIVDAKRRVRFIHRGYHGESTRKEYEKEIEQLLKEAQTK